MSWDALCEYLAMDGDSVYVWGAYALAIGLVLVEVVLLRVRKRSVFGYLGRRMAKPRVPQRHSLTRRDAHPSS